MVGLRCLNAAGTLVIVRCPVLKELQEHEQFTQQFTNPSPHLQDPRARPTARLLQQHKFAAREAAAAAAVRALLPLVQQARTHMAEMALMAGIEAQQAATPGADHEGAFSWRPATVKPASGTVGAAQQHHLQPPAAYQQTVAAAGGAPHHLRASADGGLGGASPGVGGEPSGTMVVRQSVDSSSGWGATVVSPAGGPPSARAAGRRSVGEYRLKGGAGVMVLPLTPSIGPCGGCVVSCLYPPLVLLPTVPRRLWGCWWHAGGTVSRQPRRRSARGDGGGQPGLHGGCAGHGGGPGGSAAGCGGAAHPWRPPAGAAACTQGKLAAGWHKHAPSLMAGLLGRPIKQSLFGSRVPDLLGVATRSPVQTEAQRWAEKLHTLYSSGAVVPLPFLRAVDAAPLALLGADRGPPGVAAAGAQDQVGRPSKAGHTGTYGWLGLPFH